MGKLTWETFLGLKWGVKPPGREVKMGKASVQGKKKAESTKKKADSTRSQ